MRAERQGNGRKEEDKSFSRPLRSEGFGSPKANFDREGYEELSAYHTDQDCISTQPPSPSVCTPRGARRVQPKEPEWGSQVFVGYTIDCRL